MRDIYAAIDIGTNSVRLLIGEITNDGNQVIPLFMDLRTTRLGEGMSKTGEVSVEAIKRTIDAINYLKTHIEKYEVNNIRAVATSAVREAKNTEQVVTAIQEETGIRVDVISGEEEAKLSYIGASSSIETQKANVVVDIGGGSTEIIFKDESKLITSSIKVGAVRCTEDSSNPSELYSKLEDTLKEVKKLNGFNLIAVGGTATTLAAIKKKLTVYDPRLTHGTIVNINELTSIIFDLAGKSVAERKNIPGMQPERADIIVAGLMILWVIMTNLNCNEVIISEADILNGIILDYSPNNS